MKNTYIMMHNVLLFVYLCTSIFM